MFDEYAPLFEFLQNQGTKTYLVGGAVRDLLINQPSHDLDFVVLGDAPRLARKTANHLHGAYYLMDAEHGTARVLINADPDKNLVLDFSDARSGILEKDLEYRDFTINAIALDLTTQKIIDPMQGSADLRQKVLKVCRTDSFLQDPVRVLRAIRFSLSLHLRIEPETKSLLYQAVPLLPRISGERQRDELYRMMSSGKTAAALRLLHHTGIMDIVFPELDILLKDQLSSPGAPSIDTLVNTLQNIDLILNFIEGKRDLVPENLYSNLIFLHLGPYRQKLLLHLQNHLTSDRSLRGLICLAGIFFAIFIDRAKQADNRELDSQQIDSLIERLKILALSKAEIQYFQNIATNSNLVFSLLSKDQVQILQDSPDSPDQENPLNRRNIYRYFKNTGEAGIDICLLSLALFGAQSGMGLNQPTYTHLLTTVTDLFEGYWKQKSEIIAPQPLINGDDIMKILSVPAGEKVGQILDLLKEEQAAGNIQTEQQAIDFARSIWEQ